MDFCLPEEGKRIETNLPKPLVILGSDPLVQHSLSTIKCETRKDNFGYWFQKR